MNKVPLRMFAAAVALAMAGRTEAQRNRIAAFLYGLDAGTLGTEPHDDEGGEQPLLD